MHQRLEHLIDHADVVVAFKLALHVHEIAIQRVQATREKLADMKTNRRRTPQQLAGVGHDMKRAGCDRADRGRGRFAQERCHFAKNHAGLGRRRNADLVFQHLHLSFDEKIKTARTLALAEDDLSCLEPAHFAVPNQLEYRVHRGRNVTTRGSRVNRKPDTV